MGKQALKFISPEFISIISPEIPRLLPLSSAWNVCRSIYNFHVVDVTNRIAFKWSLTLLFDSLPPAAYVLLNVKWKGNLPTCHLPTICRTNSSLSPILFADYSKRGPLKFGDKCEKTEDCGFPDSVCDPKKKSCQCIPEYSVTNHIDKCGRGEYRCYAYERKIAIGVPV